MSRRAAALVVALLLILSGCGASITEKRGGAANFDSGKAAYDRRDYVEAQLDLKSYVEQYPGTDKTDDALYYLGLAYMKTKEYALASSQFDRLTPNFPQPEYHPHSSFYLPPCADPHSPPPALDQPVLH